MTSCIHTGTCVYKHKKCSHCFFTYIFVRKNYSDNHLSTFTCINVLSSGATSGAGTAYPSGTPGSPPRLLVWFVLLDFQFYLYVLQIVVCPFVLFLLAIVLSVLRVKDSDYPFGTFKLFLKGTLVTLTRAGYCTILRFCEHFTCLSC